MSDNCCSGESSTCCSGRGPKMVVVILLLAAIGFVFYAKSANKPNPNTENQVSQQAVPVSPASVVTVPAAVPATSVVPPVENKIPKLVDLGATKCIPCKMMAPILEELKKEYQGKMEVVFIDVWENKKAAADYMIETIPTQIFFDPDGKELFRHVSFFSKEDILAKWKELGYDFSPVKTEKP